MAIIETYSMRLKRESGQPDVWQYDNIPKTLRIQIWYIIQDAVGKPFGSDGRNFQRKGYRPSIDIYQYIEDKIKKALGVLELPYFPLGAIRGAHRALEYYFSNEEVTLQLLDAIELAFITVSEIQNGNIVSEAINDLNTRFRQHGIGYQFEAGRIMRSDSKYIHVEAVKPALSLLSSGGYEGAEQEFMKAHEHYRKNNFKEAIVNCSSALESVLKSICGKHEWQHDPEKDTASKLIDICIANNLIPAFLQQKFQSLQSMLKSGAPTIRNKRGGHGQGIDIQDVPDYMVAYTLHITASTIVFLIEAEKCLSKAPVSA